VKPSPPKAGKPFPLDEGSKNGKPRLSRGMETDNICDIPNGIISHPSRRPDRQPPRNVSLCPRSRIVMNSDISFVSSIECVSGSNAREWLTAKRFTA
jgi:hypothetical protein